MAEHREASQLVGEFLREMGVLIGVLWPMEDGIKRGQVDGMVLTLALMAAAFLLWWGIILEGKDEE